MSSSRRTFLLRGVAGLGSVSLGGCLPTPSFDDDDGAPPFGPAPLPFEDTASWQDTAVQAPSCSVTAPYDEGPYFRPGAPARVDLRTAGETGVQLTLSGVIRSARDCSLLSGAVLELWHVMQSGQYDMSTAELHYRTRLEMGFDGAYSVTTLRPINYPTGNGVIAQHLHAKVSMPGFDTLITQLRFVGDPHDDGRCPASLKLNPSERSDGSQEAVFDFAISPN